MGAASSFLPFAFALQLLHCKNITTPDVVRNDPEAVIAEMESYRKLSICGAG